MRCTVQWVTIQYHELENLFISIYFGRPYDNRWSKTMVGYGPESTHFAIELTYNYGVTSYELGKINLIKV